MRIVLIIILLILLPIAYYLGYDKGFKNEIVKTDNLARFYTEGYTDGSKNVDVGNLIEHTTALTNIIAQQLEYEKSIANCAH